MQDYDPKAIFLVLLSDIIIAWKNQESKIQWNRQCTLRFLSHTAANHGFFMRSSMWKNCLKVAPKTLSSSYMLKILLLIMSTIFTIQSHPAFETSLTGPIVFDLSPLNTRHNQRQDKTKNQPTHFFDQTQELTCNSGKIIWLQISI